MLCESYLFLLDYHKPVQNLPFNNTMKYLILQYKKTHTTRKQKMEGAVTNLRNVI